jgi:hypothetical protein
VSDAHVVDGVPRIASEHLDRARAVDGHGDQRRPQIAAIVFDLVDDRQQMSAVGREHDAVMRSGAGGQRGRLRSDSPFALPASPGRRRGRIERLRTGVGDIDDEEMRRTVGEVAETVGMPAHTRDAARRFRLCRAALDGAVAPLLGDPRRERDASCVGRPREGPHAAAGLGRLHRLATGCRDHEDLRDSVGIGAHESDVLTVGRPAATSPTLRA